MVMMFRADLAKLLAAARWASQALGLGSTSPALTGLLLDIDPEAVTVSGFNGAVSARVRVPVGEATSGRMLLPGLLFGRMLGSLSGGQVEVELEKNQAFVRAGGAGFQLSVMRVESYPQLPELPPVRGRMDAKDFRTAIESVGYAVDDTGDINELRMDAVRVETAGKEITFVATDRYRVPVAVRPWSPLNGAGDASVLVRPNVLSGFAKVAKGEVQLAWPSPAADGSTSGLMGLISGEYTLVTGLAAGKFPRWQNIPVKVEDADLTAEVDAGEFQAALKRAQVVLPMNAPVQLTFADGSLHLECQGESSMAEAIEVKRMQGEPMTCWFNPAYLVQALTASPTPTVRLHLNGPRPALLTGVSNGDGSSIAFYRHILMPQRPNAGKSEEEE